MVSTSEREDTAFEIVVDNDVISEILTDALFSIDALTTVIVEFIIIPVDIAEATFESVSKTGDAPPTNDITAVATALTRLTHSVLIISEIAESMATSDAVAVNNEVDRDATSERLAEILEESAFDIVESMDESNDVVLDRVFDSDATSETRVEISVESAVDSEESM